LTSLKAGIGGKQMVDAFRKGIEDNVKEMDNIHGLRGERRK
jgi:hypothetical protein